MAVSISFSRHILVKEVVDTICQRDSVSRRDPSEEVTYVERFDVFKSKAQL